MLARVLLIGIGNPSRGDDALGPEAIERIDALGLAGVETLTDFQLQVEHALDLVGRDEVVFIDATVSGPAPFLLAPVKPAADRSATTHALSPAAVLAVYERVVDAPLPRAWVLAIRGHAFELGEPIGPAARANLDLAIAALRAHLARKDAAPQAAR